MVDTPAEAAATEDLRQAILGCMAARSTDSAPGLLLSYYVVVAAAVVDEEGDEATSYYRMHSVPLAPLHINLGLLEYARRRELEIYFPGDTE